MEIIHQYTNGNINVVLYDDGTKERVFSGNPNPIHPESIDVKITDYCDAGCRYCHEQSTKSGLHGDLDKLFEVLSVLPAGCEIAIGGGNPLSHPDLIPFLQKLKQKGIVSNITVNQKHLESYKKLILQLINDRLVHGVGISYSSTSFFPHITPILQASDNVVFHVIAGINPVEDVEILRQYCIQNNKKTKILILGYKQYGFGLHYYSLNKHIEDNKYNWHIKLAKHFKNKDLVLSFDNLAIDQLNLRRYFTDDAWNKFYMGNDFVFTMYIDGVKQNFAPSSTSNNRVDFKDMTLLDYFQTNRNKEGI